MSRYSDHSGGDKKCKATYTNLKLLHKNISRSIGYVLKERGIRDFSCVIGEAVLSFGHCMIFASP